MVRTNINVSARNFQRRLSAQLLRIARRVEGNIVRDIKREVEIALSPTQSREVRSIINSVLRGELGLTDAAGKITELILAIQNTVEVKLTRRSLSNSPKLEASVSLDLSQLTSMPFALQDTKKAQLLPWLEWLTREGDSIINTAYRVKRGTIGRSGLDYIMVKGGTWRVPPQLSGTPRNNFITRAFDKREEQIRKKVLKRIDNAIRQSGRRVI